MRRNSAFGKRFWLVPSLALLAITGAQSRSLARVSPLSVIERQIQKPNMLVLLDTSTSMMNLPGEGDLDFQEAGPDCEEGDKYCRTVGTAGRCFLSSGGMYGAGVRQDRVSCTANSQCNSKGYCKGGSPKGCQKNSDCGSGNTCVGKCSHNGASCSGDAACGAGEHLPRDL